MLTKDKIIMFWLISQYPSIGNISSSVLSLFPFFSEISMQGIPTREFLLANSSSRIDLIFLTAREFLFAKFNFKIVLPQVYERINWILQEQTTQSIKGDVSRGTGIISVRVHFKMFFLKVRRKFKSWNHITWLGVCFLLFKIF